MMNLEEVVELVKTSDNIEEIRGFALTSIARASNLAEAIHKVRGEMTDGADERTEAVVADMAERVFTETERLNRVLAVKIMLNALLGKSFSDMDLGEVDRGTEV